MGLAQKKFSISKASDPIKEGYEKTAFVKSFPALKDSLEKDLRRPNDISIKKFQNMVKMFHNDLRERLTKEDVEQLKETDRAVPPEATLLFLPGFKKPITGFNLDRIPEFSTPGWLFHAIPGNNLLVVSQTGQLESPMESVFERKHFLSTKFWYDNTSIRRLTDGISFALQNFTEYAGYIQYKYTPNQSKVLRFLVPRGANSRTGGFFIFPVKEVLKPGLILDTAQTIDGQPEICLRDQTYKRYDAAIVRNCLVALRDRIPEWLSEFDETEELFESCKKNIGIFLKIQGALEKDRRIFVWKIGEEIFFYSGWQIDHEQREQIAESVRQSSPELLKQRESLEAEYEKEKEDWFERMKLRSRIKKIDDLLSEQQDEIYKQLLRQRALFYGKGFFYEQLNAQNGLFLDKTHLTKIIEAVQEDKFFLFLLVCLDRWRTEDEFLLPPLATFAPGESPTYLDETIFRPHPMTYFYESQSSKKNFAAVCLVLTHMKKKPVFKGFSRVEMSAEEHLEAVKKMRAKHLKKLIRQTMTELAKAMELIVKRRFKTGEPCTVNITKGVLFWNIDHTDTFRNLLEKKAVLLSGLSYSEEYGQKVFDSKQVEYILHHVLKVQDMSLTNLWGYDGSFIYSSDGRVKIHYRRDGKEYSIN